MSRKVEIIAHAEFMTEYNSFESVQVYLQREGYDLIKYSDDIAGRKYIAMLSNGWVICELI